MSGVVGNQSRTMYPGLVSRSAEERAVGEFLDAARTQASALLVRGEAGIGKTTLWLAALERARASGYRVLAARTRQPETVLAYTTVGDLLATVKPSVIATIPDPQQLALKRVLMRAGDEGAKTNQRLVATAFLSVVGALADSVPTLVAVDDVQWLDSSSRAVLAYAVHRVSGRVGVLVTERDGHDHVTATSWLQLPSNDEVRETRVSPLRLDGLHLLIEQKLDRSFPRPIMTRIADTSGGNPLYALELARAIDAGGGEQVFPRTLAELVRMRIERLDDEAVEVLLAAACAPDPTVDQLAAVTGTSVEQVAALLEKPESAGIVVLDGNRVGFTHPVLARGIYTSAARARRRHWHRAWAGVTTQPESRARHLALAATSSDEATLNALDEAAAMVRAQGAPAAAAELLDLAIALGGDTPMRRFAAAEHHLRSGDAALAQGVLKPGIAQMRPGPMRALMMYTYAWIVGFTEGYPQAAAVVSDAIDDATDTPVVRIPALMALTFAQISDGIYDPALQHARQALTEAETRSTAGLLSQALAIWAYASFHCGLGYDATAMQRALELEGRTADIPTPLRPNVIHALLMGWTGRLEESATGLEAVSNRLAARGGEIEMFFVSYNRALVNVWLGRYAEAERLAEDTFQRGAEIGGAASHSIGLAVRGWVAAHAGREQDARAGLAAAIASANGRSSAWWFVLSLTGLGRLEVSLGRHAEALGILAPLLAVAEDVPNTEIATMEYLPDAIEALVAMRRLTAAEGLIDRLDRDGRELDRPWMLATAGRCRGMLLAATGNVEAALEVVEQAMAEHQRLPMPAEHARTQLLLGQLHRRLRQKRAATVAFGEALATFEQLDSPLWAALVRTEMERTNVSSGTNADLTPTERRVAELAANGLSNPDIAAATNMSRKTVEVNLSRIYRKLGIGSRAELGRRMDRL